MIDRDWSAFDFISQVVRDSGGSDKVTVNASLQQRVSSQPVCAVIGKIGFAQRIEPWNRRHEFVVHPQTTHRKVGRRRNAHRFLIGVYASNFLIHAKKVAVLFLYPLLPLFGDRSGKIEIHGVLEYSYSIAGVDPFFSRARRNITGGKIAKRRVAAFEVIISIRLRNVIWRTVLVPVLRYPNAAIVSQRLRH